MQSLRRKQLASPLIRFIESVTVQDSIYWGMPTPGNFTSYDYGLIKEIKVRLDDSAELFREQIGDESSSSSKVLVNEDLDIGGYIMLGSFGEEATEGGSPIPVEDDLIIMKADGTVSVNHLIFENLIDDEGNPIDTRYVPKGLSDAFEIRKFMKTPLFRSKDEFVRNAYL